jgi:hypothetical protein
VSARVLVAGIGNIFFADDGFGPAVLRRLAHEKLPGVRFEDYGIRGMHLAYELLAGYEAAIVVDAVSRGGPPGTLYVIEHARRYAAADHDRRLRARLARGGRGRNARRRECRRDSPAARAPRGARTSRDRGAIMVRGLILGGLAFAAVFAAERQLEPLDADIKRYNAMRAMSGDPPLARQILTLAATFVRAQFEARRPLFVEFASSLQSDLVRYMRMRAM